MKLYLVGGFLGSGKTTAIHHACLVLQPKVRVGVITNDQGEQLVDTAFVESAKVPTREVMNGCFCCNFNALEASIRSLSAAQRPEIIFAESVGSCTDLIATVVNPLKQFRPDLEVVVSVFADAQVLLQKKNKQALFKEEVEYIYQKQLEEADVLVVSKIDLLQQQQLEELKEYLSEKFADKQLFYQNSLNSESLLNWLSCLQGFSPMQARRTLEIDYNKYGIGEAKLAWLDEELEIISKDNTALEASIALANRIYSKVKSAPWPIGHLKFLLNDGLQKKKISFVSIHQPLAQVIGEGEGPNKVKMLINARVQTEPETLKQILAVSIEVLKQELNCQVIERKMLAFKPGFPKPTHRIAS